MSSEKNKTFKAGYTEGYSDGYAKAKQEEQEALAARVEARKAAPSHPHTQIEGGRGGRPATRLGR